MSSIARVQSGQSHPSEEPSQLTILNEDVLRIIFSYLGKSIIAAAGTCVSWRKIIVNEEDRRLIRNFKFALFMNECRHLCPPEQIDILPESKFDLDARFRNARSLCAEIDKTLSSLPDMPSEDIIFYCQPLLEKCYELSLKSQAHRLLIAIWNINLPEYIKFYNEKRGFDNFRKSSEIIQSLLKYHIWTKCAEDLDHLINDQHLLPSTSYAFAYVAMKHPEIDDKLELILVNLNKEMDSGELHRKELIFEIQQYIIAALIEKNVKKNKLKEALDWKEQVRWPILSDPIPSHAIISLNEALVRNRDFENVKELIEKSRLAYYRPPHFHTFYIEIVSGVKKLADSKDEFLRFDFSLKKELLVQFIKDKVDIEVAEKFLKELAEDRLLMANKIELASSLWNIDREFAMRLINDLFPSLMPESQDEKMTLSTFMFNLAGSLDFAFPDEAQAACLLALKLCENKVNPKQLDICIKTGCFEQAKSIFLDFQRNRSNVSENMSPLQMMTKMREERAIAEKLSAMIIAYHKYLGNFKT